MTKRRRTSTESNLKSYPEKARSLRSFVPQDKEPDWEISLSGDLGDKESDLVARLVDVPRSSRGTIYFDSPGGSVYAGLTLASLIRLRQLNVAGVALGECSSAAILPFAACKHRFVTAYTTLLFHPIRWQSEDEVRLEEAAEWARHFKVLETDFDRLQAQLFGCRQSVLDRWTRPGRFVSGQELADAGLAQLIDPFSTEDQWKVIEARQRICSRQTAGLTGDCSISGNRSGVACVIQTAGRRELVALHVPLTISNLEGVR